MEDIKRDIPILATSGRDRADRTRRLAARVPELDVLVDRENGGWKITDKGRTVLEFMEGRTVVDVPVEVAAAQTVVAPVPPLPPLAKDASESERTRLDPQPFNHAAMAAAVHTLGFAGSGEDGCRWRRPRHRQRTLGRCRAGWLTTLRIVSLGEIQQASPGERIGLLGEGPDPMGDALVEFLLHDTTPRH
ncbi:hypothetical protein IVB48_23335 [Bradyrhizobium sp. 76]|nr:hypothetical protein [Bradyrhizobium sp. 76]UPJ62194.1 hypothetical protein IVB24_39530 [Bradyrhizobium sp. 192]